MIDGDILVIDGVTHILDLDPTHMNPEAKKYDVAYMSASGPGRPLPPQMASMAGLEGHQVSWRAVHLALSPKDSKYTLPYERFAQQHTPEAFLSASFNESQTDIMVHHAGLPGPPIASGMKYLRTGSREAAEMAPGRVIRYGGIGSIFNTAAAIEEIDQQIEEDDIVAIKFYPYAWDEGRLKTVLLDDEDVAFPLLEHCQKRGMKAVGIHKATGSGLTGMGVGDLEKAVVAFPDLNFEVVHGGLAFLDDTLALLRLPNVYINLEVTISLLFHAPRQFADIIGRTLGGLLTVDYGMSEGENKIIFGSGSSFAHPRPMIEALWNWEMPRDMVEGWGYPEVTREAKRKILGANWATMHGLDIEALKAGIPMDDARRRQLAGDFDEPWSKLPDPRRP